MLIYAASFLPLLGAGRDAWRLASFRLSGSRPLNGDRDNDFKAALSLSVAAFATSITRPLYRACHLCLIAGVVPRDRMIMSMLPSKRSLASLAKSARDITLLPYECPDRAEVDADGSVLQSEDERHERLERIARAIDFNANSLGQRYARRSLGRRISFWPEVQSPDRRHHGWGARD